MFWKKKRKETFGLMATGIGIGVGSQIAGEVGATDTQLAMGKLGKGVKTAGGIMAGGMVMDSLGYLTKSAKKKKK